MRTLLDNSQSKCPERKTALVSKELSRYNISIAALSETRFPDEGQLVEKQGGYTFFWKGKPEDERRDSGVGFAIQSSLLEYLEDLPHGFSDRISICRLALSHERFVTIISVYAPTMGHSQEVIDQFYSDLNSVIAKVSIDDKLIILGDFNSRVGTDNTTWPVLGPHGVGNCNSNGTKLLTFCTENDLVVTNTIFQQKDKYKCTWMHPRSKHWHLIDYILIRQRDRKDIHSVRTMRGADCWTDHRLVRAKLNLIVRPKVRKISSPLPKRLNVDKLKSPIIQTEFQNAINDVTLSDQSDLWNDFRDQIYEITSSIVGFKSRKNQDWFDDNEEGISELLHHKNQAHEKLLASSSNTKDIGKLTSEYQESKATAQREIRRMKNEWWEKMATEAQAAADRKDTKTFYSYVNAVFGPSQTNFAPVRSKDGKTLLKDIKSIQNRWVEHYSELLNRPSSVDHTIIDQVEQLPIVDQMDIAPTRDETINAVKKLNTGKSPGLDGLTSEILKSGGEKMIDLLLELILHYWETGAPQDWIDATLISLYKSGPRDQCGNFRGIALLSVVGKVLARILLDRLVKHVAPVSLPESQCGFRANRGTADMVFTARQLQEKCTEHHLDLYHCFIDLSKAFDTVNREALWKILRKKGCPDKFVKVLQSLHDGMKARINFGGDLSDPFPVDNGVKQGDLDAPVLFAIYFAAMLEVAFKDNTSGIYIRYRTTGKVFDLSRLRAKTKVSYALIRDLLYADDADLVTHTEADLQSLLTAFDSTAEAFGLTINLKKTVVMFQPAPCKTYHPPTIYLKGEVLKVVDKFVYLGGTLHRTGSLDSEVSSRIQKAADSFGKLEKKVWSQHDIKLQTKIMVYRTFVLTSLLYTSETWTTYARHIKMLERFHQKCLRHILRINWQSLTPDTEVLAQAGLSSIESMIHLYRLRWTGHLVRLEDDRIPKQLLFGELSLGKRPQFKPKKRFKDSLKDSLAKTGIGWIGWENQAQDRVEWRQKIHKGVKAFEDSRVNHAKLKRAARKGDMNVLATSTYSFFPCPSCDKLCLSKAGLKSHQRSHIQQPTTDYSTAIDHICQKCKKECKSAGGLKRHFNRMHKDDSNYVHSIPGGHMCSLCGFVSRTLAGLKSHIRAHTRKDG